MSSDGQGSVSPAGGASDNRGEKSKRSGNLKHELRTPLNHIIGYCEMLMEQAQDDGLDIFIADLDRIHSAGEQLLGIIDDLCDPVAHRKMDEASMHHGAGFFRFRFAEGAYRGQTFARPNCTKFRLN